MGEDKSPRCTIAKERLEQHFQQEPATSLDVSPPDWLPSPPGQVPPDDLTYPIVKEEIRAQLRRLPSQSSPGPDGIPYYVWKGVNHDQLADLFNICLLNKRIPDSWKQSTTILLYKRGDEDDPANWRPISLQSTRYKVYAALMAKRLATWAILENKMSSAQKGSSPLKAAWNTRS